MTHLRKESLSLDTIEAWIAANWKGKNKMKAENYRPISLTNQLSKCQETLMKDLIIGHMAKAGMIDNGQHGSVKNRSTLTQLLEQQAKILEMLENGENVEIIFLDFCKKYDKVDLT